MRVVVLAALAALLAAGTARAQATAGAPPVTAAAPPAPAAAPAAKTWSFSAAANIYVVPDGSDYVQPAVTADRDWLHLEGRFNYEDRDTGSAWVGYNFSVGETVTLEFTPMIGAVLGATDGIAPGYRGSLGWGMLQVYSETEYVFDTDESDDSFLYTWSELTFAPADWCRFGLVVQRTKAYDTQFDIQRGFFVGFSYRRAAVTAYVFNPDADKPSVVVAVVLSF